MTDYDETSNNYCSYGCGQRAYYKLKKSGKYICSSHHVKCPVLVKIKEDKKKEIGSDGLSINQRKELKTKITKSIRGDDGLNIYERTNRKSAKIKKETILENGETLSSYIVKKGIQKLKNTIDPETGVDFFTLQRLKRRKHMTIADKNKFESDFSFIDSKYTKWYFSIIENSKKEIRTKSLENYYEKHHIIPKSLGGKDIKENLILLTAREHYICHLLLTKMTEGNNKIKMMHAFDMMSVHTGNRYKMQSALYQLNKIKLSKCRSEKLIGTGVCYIPKEIRQKNSSIKRPYNHDRMWVFNDELKKSEIIWKTDLDSYLQKGYFPGRKFYR